MNVVFYMPSTHTHIHCNILLKACEKCCINSETESSFFWSVEMKDTHPLTLHVKFRCSLKYIVDR